MRWKDKRELRQTREVPGATEQQCTVCKKWLPQATSFYYNKHKNCYYARCKKCHTALAKARKRERGEDYLAQQRQRRVERYREDPEKAKSKAREDRAGMKGQLRSQAYHAVGVAEKYRGFPRPVTCSVCGRFAKGRMMQAHHPDHHKPLEVVYCCAACHKKIYVGEMPCPAPITLPGPGEKWSA